VPDVRRAGAEDVAVLSPMLARAFFDDPVAAYIFPDPARREARLRRFFALQLRHNYLHRGHVLTDSERRSCAMWLPPDPLPPSGGDNLVQSLLPLLVRARVSSARRLARLLLAHHPRQAHWYLGTVGTEPACQGNGLGRSLIVAVLYRADAESLPAYLECSSAANVPFYARLGFVVTGELDAAAGGPRLWLMWREPQPPYRPSSPLR